jgi:hypothetical protein
VFMSGCRLSAIGYQITAIGTVATVLPSYRPDPHARGCACKYTFFSRSTLVWV